MVEKNSVVHEVPVSAESAVKGFATCTGTGSTLATVARDMNNFHGNDTVSGSTRSVTFGTNTYDGGSTVPVC